MKKPLFVAFLLCNLAIFSCAPIDYNNVVVGKVVDGDTIKLVNGENVRLIGIDCPEVWESDKLHRDAHRLGQDATVIQAMGKEASEFTKNIVEGRKVRLEFDVQKRDKYSRLLAYVYILDFDLKRASQEVSEALIEKENSGIELFLNALIIQSGYAQPMTIPPNVKCSELFQKLYKEARENKRGLWR